MIINKLLAFAFVLSIFSGSQNLGTVNHPKGTEITNNADVINIHGNVTNLYKMDEFMRKMNGKENASLLILHYTIEGDPIYHSIKYQDEKFEVQIDRTQDKYGSGIDKIITHSCDKFDKTETNVEMKYTLKGCSGETESIDVLYLNYDVSMQDLFEFQLKYGDNQANEINTMDKKLVKDLTNGQMESVSDFQLNKEERQTIYKKMWLSNALREKKFATCTQKPSYYLKVKINGAVLEYNWSDCPNSEDNKTMTDLEKFIVEIVTANQSYSLPNTSFST